MLAGNLASIGVGGIVTCVVSYFVSYLCLKPKLDVLTVSHHRLLRISTLISPVS